MMNVFPLSPGVLLISVLALPPPRPTLIALAVLAARGGLAGAAPKILHQSRDLDEKNQNRSR